MTELLVNQCIIVFGPALRSYPHLAKQPLLGPESCKIDMQIWVCAVNRERTSGAGVDRHVIQLAVSVKDGRSELSILLLPYALPIGGVYNEAKRLYSQRIKKDIGCVLGHSSVGIII